MLIERENTMKVIIKKPGEKAEIYEVSGIQEINKLVGNIGDNGEGYNYVGSDIRQNIGRHIDMYVKEDAIFNPELKENLWVTDYALVCGTIIFAGYDKNNLEKDYGACSLTAEQIEYCLNFIAKKEA